MGSASIFLVAAFYFPWMLSPFLLSIPTASATANLEPCQNYEYNFMEMDHSFSYTECKNVFLQPGQELTINIPPQNIEYIVFKNSILPAIPDGAFTPFTELAELHLNRNGLKTIVPGVFNGLTQLRVLHLQDNNIMKISKGTLAVLTKLEILDVSRNVIISLEEDCFRGLVNLKFINLSRNNLYFLDPDSFVSLTVLEVLDISHNYLFMSELNSTLNLKTPYLEKLLINNNLLQHFSVSSVENLNSLELLDVSFNALTAVNFASIIAPKFANFSNNQISTVKGWSDFYQSNVIDLTSNKINSSTAMFGDTKILYLGQNEMETLDAVMFINSGDIIELNLSYNFIRKITNDSFGGLVNLETLYLNNNQISYLPRGCFTNLDSLKVLSLSENYLGYLEDGAFTGLSKLTHLYLDNNRLSIITENTFYGLNNLRNMYLNQNLLRMVNVETLLKQLPNLNTIYLHNNQWDCGEFLDVTEALKNHSVKLPEGNDLETAQVFKIACDNFNLKIVSHRSGNKKVMQVLYKMCSYFMMFTMIVLDVLILTWYFFRFKVTIRTTEARIRKIQMAIIRVEARDRSV